MILVIATPGLLDPGGSDPEMKGRCGDSGSPRRSLRSVLVMTGHPNAAPSPLLGCLGFLALFPDRRCGSAEIRPRIGDRGEARGRVAGGEIGWADLGRKLLPGERH